MDDSQKLFLERQWQLLDGNKKLRAHIPTVCCTLIIAICAFYFHKGNFTPMNSKASWLFCCFHGLLGVAGLTALWLVHSQYDFSNSKIEHLYNKFELTYLADHGHKNKDKFESGDYLFYVGYGAIIAFTVIAIIATCVIK